MARLVIGAAARRALGDIAAYIERESMSRAVADRFTDKIVAYCEQVALLPGVIGRPRPEIRQGYRSVTFGSYVIFIRYGDESSPRSHLYVMHIVHGSRDMDAYFIQNPDS